MRCGPRGRCHGQDPQKAGENIGTDKHKIGRERELEIAEFLKRIGLINEAWQAPRTKWGPQDVFGFFDLICMRDEWPPIFVQVKRARFTMQKPEICRWVRKLRPAAHFWCITYDTRKDGTIRYFELETLGWEDGHWYRVGRWDIVQGEILSH